MKTHNWTGCQIVRISHLLIHEHHTIAGLRWYDKINNAKLMERSKQTEFRGEDKMLFPGQTHSEKTWLKEN